MEDNNDTDFDALAREVLADPVALEAYIDRRATALDQAVRELKKACVGLPNIDKHSDVSLVYAVASLISLAGVHQCLALFWDEQARRLEAVGIAGGVLEEMREFAAMERELVASSRPLAEIESREPARNFTTEE